jgi:hypothetical protein
MNYHRAGAPLLEVPSRDGFPLGIGHDGEARIGDAAVEDRLGPSVGLDDDRGIGCPRHRREDGGRAIHRSSVEPEGVARLQLADRPCDGSKGRRRAEAVVRVVAGGRVDEVDAGHVAGERPTTADRGDCSDDVADR